MDGWMDGGGEGMRGRKGRSEEGRERGVSDGVGGCGWWIRDGGGCVRGRSLAWSRSATCPRSCASSWSTSPPPRAPSATTSWQRSSRHPPLLTPTPPVR